MNKSSKSVALVLISSSVFIAGCRRSPDAYDANNANNAASSSGGAYHRPYTSTGRSGGWFSWGGHATGGGGSRTGSTTRGGFGGFGHMFGGGHSGGS